MKSLLSISGEGTNTSSYVFRSFSPILEEQHNRVEAYRWNAVAPSAAEATEQDEKVLHLNQDDVEVYTPGGRLEDEIPDETAQFQQQPYAPPPLMNEVQQHADSVLQDARISAEKILESARREAEELRKAAQEQGREAGYEQGLNDGLKEAEHQISSTIHDRVQQNLETVRELIESVEQEKKKILETYLADLRDLALSVAEKIVDISLRSSGSIIEKMILAATEKCKTAQWIKINIARSDAEVMMLSDEDLIQALRHLSDNVTVTRIENAESGECVIEFPDEIIDASVKTQMDHIREMITSEEISLGDTD